jgi:choline dehydrogenase
MSDPNFSNFESHYDYIIIGGGTSGCLIASELSGAMDRQRRGKRILLIESGNLPTAVHERPADYVRSFGSESDWFYETEPQTELGGRQLRWNSGRVLGGSSSINAMIYIRGHRTDFDAWPSFSKQAWNAESVLELFKRIEPRLLGPADDDASVEGYGLSNDFLESAIAANHRFNDDFNVDEQVGVGRFVRTQSRSQRRSSWTAYLEHQFRPLKDSSHTSLCAVDVLSNHDAVRFTIENDRVRSVEIHDRITNCRHEIQVTDSLVLAAGTVQSPAILHRSGIGDPDWITQLGVESIVKNQNVGRHLADHLCVPLVYGIQVQNQAGREKWLATSNQCEVGGFARLDRADSGPPDLQIHVTPNHYLRPTSVKHIGSTLSIVTNVLRPTSRGTVRSADKNSTRVRVDPQYLTVQSDRDALRTALGISAEIADQNPIAEHIGKSFFPRKEIENLDKLDRWINKTANTIFHPVGTCRIGDSTEGVVDDKLRVHGLENCFVGDASVMPEIPRGNTQAMTYAIGQRLADELIAKL